MNRWIPFLFPVLLLTASAAEPWPFYAFQNGVHFGGPEARVKALKELGYDGIGSAKLKTGEDLPARLKAYDDAGIKLFSFYVGGKLGKDGHTYSPEITKAIEQLKGRDTVIELFVQGSASANNDEQAVAFVREIADQAKVSGLKVVLYPHSGFYIDTLGDAVRVAKLCERDNVGAMFNLCHFLKVEPDADLDAELENAKGLLWQASVCGADDGGTSWGELIQPLNKGTFDQAALLAKLKSLGFDGPVGLQCYAVKGDARENLAGSLGAWKKLWE